MREIEAKILEIDRSAIEARLRELGAELAFDGQIDELHWDLKDRWLRKRQQILRLRRVGDEVQLTSKRSLSKRGAKVVEEITARQADFKETEELLRTLGFKVLVERSKHRRSYRIGRVQFEIDTYEEIPTYLEIEAPTRGEVRDWGRKLGVREEQFLSWSVSEVFRHYRGRRPSKRRPGSGTLGSQ